MRPVSAPPAHGAHGVRAPDHPRGGERANAARQEKPARARAQDTFEAPAPPGNYAQVSASLAGDPAAQQALQGLMARGGGRELLGQLTRMSGNPEMLAQVVKDVADPESIRQGRGNKFCGATSALADLAGTDPAEYARVAADLSLNGRSKMADGSVINAQRERPAAGRMSATQRLMAPALTERANGKRYDVNANGVSTAEGGKVPRGERRLDGMKASGMERMQEMLTGEQQESLYIPGANDRGRGKAVDRAETIIGRELKRGEQASVEMGGHWYQVVGQSGGRITLQDHQTGETRTVSADRFLRRADAVTFDSSSGNAGKAFDGPSKKEKEGGGRNGYGSANPTGDLGML